MLNVTIHFSRHVTLPSPNPESAFLLERQGSTDTVTLNATADDSGDVTIVTLTWGSSGTSIDHGSLQDGRYTLTIDDSLISSGNFDGDLDGFAGGDYVLASAPHDIGGVYESPTNIWRHYGDGNGDGDVIKPTSSRFAQRLISLTPHTHKRMGLQRERNRGSGRLRCVPRPF
ncbi:MAG: hypothetical protein ACJ8C4_13900 [Gemmataceae bacterium]